MTNSVENYNFPYPVLKEVVIPSAHEVEYCRSVFGKGLIKQYEIPGQFILSRFIPTNKTYVVVGIDLFDEHESLIFHVQPEFYKSFIEDILNENNSRKNSIPKHESDFISSALTKELTLAADLFNDIAKQSYYAFQQDR